MVCGSPGESAENSGDAHQVTDAAVCRNMGSPARERSVLRHALNARAIDARLIR